MIDNDFIGDNVGQASLYLPSLAVTDSILRIDERGTARAGNKAERFEIDLGLLQLARRDKKTTNPALVTAGKEIRLKKEGV